MFKNESAKIFFIILSSLLLLLSNPQKIFASQILFQDDFNDGNADSWEEQLGPGGSWAVQSNEYVGQVGYNTDDLPTYSLVGDESWTDYTFEVRMKGITGHDKKLRFRYKNSNEYYELNLRSDPGNDLAVAKHGANGWLQFVTDIPNYINTWYDIKVELKDNNIKIYVNEALKYDFTDNDDPILNGKIGLEVWPGIGASFTKNAFDDIKVTETPPEPFLDLPWEYGQTTMSGELLDNTFSFKAQKINAYFDHQYPLLSAGLNEPASDSATTLNFLNQRKPWPEMDYSSHDGYDWGTLAGATVGTPVLAAADGCASYVQYPALYENETPNNVILIDHGNFYQTRYLHLQTEELVTQSSTCVSVTKGQPIGKVGFSGHVIPSGIQGAHIHFDVTEDKNRDGNFEDNIPDGLTDPFGWQSSEVPDPWPNHPFNYLSEDRTGNDSHYLWLHAIPNLRNDLDSNGGFYEFQNLSLNFPPNAVQEDSQLDITPTPWVKVSDILESAGNSFKVTVKNSLGVIITQFNELFNIVIDFSDEDLSRTDPNTLQIYSSQDGVNWTPEITTLDQQTKTASAQLDHLTYFALIGERLDTESPATAFTQNDNQVTLTATDNYAGVAYTAYRFSKTEDWQQYTAPFTVTDGEYIIYYYSVDNHENVEEVKETSFSFITPSPSPTPIPTPTPSPTPTPTPSPSPSPTPATLKLQYYPDPAARGKFVDTVLPDFNIVNAGVTPVPLSELKIRYYFTQDTQQPQDMYFYCDFTELPLGCSSITGFAERLSTPLAPKADSYLEVGFTGGILPAGSQTWDILVDFTREDEGNFNQYNDYSFQDREPTFRNWKKVTLYRNGVLVWGVEPE